MTNRVPSGQQTTMYRLTAPVKDYAWGSTTLLADLTGTAPSSTPQAELWFGTHPTTQTTLSDGRALADLIDLPYLVKLLAAAQPLSIQAHPTIIQAEAGFAAENAAGLELDDPQRTYRDANHKPEMLVALTDFTALAGFRDPAASAQTFGALAQLVELPELAVALSNMATQLAEGKIKEVFGQLVDTESPFWQSDGWTKTIFDAVEHANLDDDALVNALAASKIHPDDPGALVTLLMNLVRLSPGESMFIPDGTIHAYVSGLGLEIMATSDNVIRGGLTIKHIDLEELDRVVRYQPDPPPLLSPRVDQSATMTVTHFEPPVDDFALTRYDLHGDQRLAVVPDRPRIAICTGGTGQLISQDDTIGVTPGTGIYLLGNDLPVELSAGPNGVTMFIAFQP
ncbi:mannose-6-phosphate isomerase, class I [Yaniella halotolerans]|uniref:mannose-6-phosphate isomerase, class I n=1 Tax=Yaniella halotolerans TaxID=225453 RepID=UPI0003B533C3|nr:mannose-6-phosphate isomerase, class I [Yaniella halotolerans]